jgi:predicted N-acetyltransferase YhbS
MAARKRLRAGSSMAQNACTSAGPMSPLIVTPGRPSSRGRGIGKALMHALAADLRAAGYHLLRLDSANFMTEAHALYRSVGFVVCEPYAESEIPQEFHANWTFMERALVS